MANPSGTPRGAKQPDSDDKRRELIKKSLTIGGWVVAGVLTLLLMAMIFGDRIQWLLDDLGLGWLYHEESGVYADCSKPSNRSNPYCIKRRSDGEWRGLSPKRGGSNPFTLND